MLFAMYRPFYAAQVARVLFPPLAKAIVGKHILHILHILHMVVGEMKEKKAFDQRIIETTIIFLCRKK